jgi:MFS family permease
MSILNLKEAERKAYASKYNDGLFDLLIGAMFLAGPITSLCDHYGLKDPWAILISLGFLVAIGAFFVYAKRKYANPRMGFVRPSQKQKRKIRYIMILNIAILIAGLVTFILALTGILPPTAGHILGLPTPAVVFFLGAVVVFSVMAFLIKFNRLYLYGLLYGLSIPLGEWIELATGFQMGSIILMFLLSISVMIAGLIIFKRFIDRTPMPDFNEVGQDAI